MRKPASVVLLGGLAVAIVVAIAISGSFLMLDTLPVALRWQIVLPVATYLLTSIAGPVQALIAGVVAVGLVATNARIGPEIAIVQLSAIIAYVICIVLIRKLLANRTHSVIAIDAFSITVAYAVYLFVISTPDIALYGLNGVGYAVLGLMLPTGFVGITNLILIIPLALSISLVARRLSNAFVLRARTRD